ncbi:MAG: hypothetical protein ABH818_00035 [Patescibacteria group bacterium]|nr:hypothetical protein [Patescibacteria group bacterium]
MLDQTLSKLAGKRKIVQPKDFLAQKSLLSEIYGSNLFLKDKTLVAESDQKANFPLKNIWFCWQNLNEKVAGLGDNSDFIPLLVP